jgi:endonuclease YncB( thermonuclease family)
MNEGGKIVTPSYRRLRQTVRSLLEEGRERARQAVERERAITYWRVGEAIHTHALGNADRAPLGDQVVRRLADDVDISHQRLYEAIRFYRRFPVFRSIGKLTWTHYLRLMKLPTDEARTYYEQAAIEGAWSVKYLRDRIDDETYARHLIEQTESIARGPVSLVAKRGDLGLYRVKCPPGCDLPGLFVDLGFGHFWKARARRAGFEEGDIVRATQSADGSWGIAKAKDASSRRLFTHRMSVTRVVDGDTLVVTMELPSGDVLYDRLRLRGIDTPEMQTKAGQRAKVFVEERLADCDFIVVRTARAGRYGRYVADVYYLAGEGNPDVVAETGTYLNRELVENGVAERLGN